MYIETDDYGGKGHFAKCDCYISRLK